jgi:hypothetical protein
MAFEIHRREFFEPEDDSDPDGKEHAHWGWRILSVLDVAAIVVGLAYLFVGKTASGLP